MSRLSHVLAALALLLAGAVLVGGTLQPMTGAAALRALQGVGAAVAVVVAAAGLGGALLREAEAVAATALGLGVIGLALLPVGMLGALTPPVLAGVVVVAGAGWLRRPRLHMDWPPARSVLVAAPFLILAGLDALAPPTDTDEVYQHLALPSLFLIEEGLVGGLLQPDASRPMGLHLVYTTLLALGGEPAPKILAWLLSCGLLLRVRAVGQRLGGPVAGDAALLALLGSYTVLRELGLAYNNLPTALLGVLAFEACLSDRGWRMAAFAGLGLASKYTLAPTVFGIFLLYWSRRWKAVPQMALLSVGALALVAPWWVRNLVEGLHPLFPYAGWPEGENFEFAFFERYGMGREPLDFLLLPWNASVHADPESYVFLGRISPLFLIALPAVAVAAPRHRWLVVPAIGFLGWAMGPHWLRYAIMPGPLLALAVGVGIAQLPRWGQGIAVAAWLAGLPANVGPWLKRAAPGVPVALGQGDREELLEEKVPGYACAAWINDYAPSDARTVLLFAWPGYYLERPWALSSVEDHVPTRHLLYTYGDQSLAWLREQGFTHALVGRPRFIKKVFFFLEESEFQRQFRQPEQALEELLLEQARLEFEHARYGVWSL